MNTKRSGTIFTIVGLIGALVTGLLIIAVLRGATKPSERPLTVPVIYVNQFIPARTTLGSVIPTPQALAIREVPQEFVPQTALQALLQNAPPLTNTVTVESKAITDVLPASLFSAVTLIDLQPGDMLQTNQLDRSAGLKPGQRAVSLAVNQVTSVGGTVRPGQHVDVIASYEVSLADNEKEGRTELLLQDVEVLAVFGQLRAFLSTQALSGSQASFQDPYVTAEEPRFTPDGEMMKDSTITLALSSIDAMRLTYMANFAKEVRLVVRSPSDRELSPIQPVTGASIH